MRRHERRYGEHPDQTAELVLPGAADRRPLPVAVLLHGGFWRHGYGRELMDDLATDLAGRGWAALNVEYRRIGAGGGWPATPLDVAAAIDALATAPVPEPVLDLGRVVAVGHSAGGQLALWAASRVGLPAGTPGAEPVLSPCAVVAQAPVADLADAARRRLSRDAAAALLGGEPDDPSARTRYGLASPFERLPLGIPQLVVHGAADEDVPAAMSQAYVRAARALGDEVEHVEMGGLGHMEHLDPASPLWAAAVAFLGRFR